MFRASLERIKGILWFNVHLGLINPGGPGMFLLKRVGLIHPNTDVSCQLGTHWSRAGSQVFAQLTFVAPVLAIFPWLGPEAGDPMEVEPLSPTGSGGWGRDLGGWGSSQLDRFIFFGGKVWVWWQPNFLEFYFGVDFGGGEPAMIQISGD